MIVKPEWLRVKAPQWQRVGNVKEILRDLSLNTVCEEASCPNIGECFQAGTATFLIMGPACTRACPYCDIDFEKKPQALDPSEPQRLAEAVKRLNLNHVVITAVNRDDLLDGGASQFVSCINAVRTISPKTTIEVLIPDLCGNWEALAVILSAQPEVLNHNTETIPRLYRRVRPQGDYQRSLTLLQKTTNGAVAQGSAPSGGTAFPIASTVSVPADASLIVVDKTTAIYLQEGTSITVTSGTASKITYSISYEIIA